MLETLQKIFLTSRVETSNNTVVELQSNTSEKQGVFLQELFDLIKPKKSIEIGLAYGISALFILEKHKEYNSNEKSHIIIEPFPWNGVAEYNIEAEKLTYLVEYMYKKSHDVLPELYMRGERIQFAYIDTTKVFDTVLQDFYFIDKLLDVGGVIIFDDCGGGWPGVQRVARFVNTLPHYSIYKKHNKATYSFKNAIASRLMSTIMSLLPYKKRIYPTVSFKTDEALGLDYSCIAFKKNAQDSRDWNWDEAF